MARIPCNILVLFLLMTVTSSNCETTDQESIKPPNNNCTITEPCPAGTHPIPDYNDGKEGCKLCRPFAELGWGCGDETRICAEGLFCNNYKVCTHNVTCPEGMYQFPFGDDCRPKGQVGGLCAEGHPCADGLYCDESRVCAKPTTNCATVTCPSVTNCSDGEYFLKADGIRDCCNSCHNYSTFGENCYKVPCADGLSCNVFYKCIPEYAAECAAIECLYPEPCTRHEYKIESNGLDVCCEYCQSYSVKGQLCDKYKKCSPGLVCNEQSTCEKTSEEDCSFVKCPEDLKCAPLQFLLKGDGVHQCCDVCRTRQAVGKSCNATQPCIDGQVCSPENKCVNLDCSYPECVNDTKCPSDSYLALKDNINRCCDTCQKYSKKGEICGKNKHCSPGLNCNNVCEE